MSQAQSQQTAESTLEHLRRYSTVVADSGEIEVIREFAPTDATTNPSLLLAAAQLPAYQSLVEDALAFGREQGGAAAAVDRLMVLFGREITRIVPRYVSTEVDARLSFDTEATIAKAHQLLAMYDSLGISPDRVLIKIASTWEGLRAARVLEAEGIRCNMTLMFGLAQAALAFDSGVTLISPFVGRITDWHKAHDKVDGYAPEDDPGVASVRHIYAYAKRFAYPTQVMAASFRNSGQVLALAGCDLLTISPQLLAELESGTQAVAPGLAPDGAQADRLRLDERGFRWHMNADPMATEKLAEGIRRFAADQVSLEKLLAERL